MKITVKIEETLCKSVEVEVPDGATLSSDVAQDAIQTVIDRYKNGDIVLTADDYTGEPNFCAETETGESTGWYN